MADSTLTALPAATALAGTELVYGVQSGASVKITANQVSTFVLAAVVALNLGAFAATTSAQLAGVISDETGTGSLVFGTSPTLVTPALGTPSAVVLTNGTGLPPGGITAIANQRFLGNFSGGSASPTAIQIIAGTNITLTPGSGTLTIAASGGGGTPGGSTTQVQYNNTGVFGGISGATTDGTTLTLVAPVLGTPVSATLTNATGLPIATGVSGLASGIATFLGTPSSANLAAAVTDETGTGVLVFGTSPTFGGQPMVQGLTTTSPAFMVQVTGDAVPRVRIGLNGNDVASIALGSGAATRDTLLERAGAANFRFGGGDAAAPVAQILSVQNVATGTTDTAGATLTIAGSVGTGTGVGGSLVFQTTPAGSTGSTQNALATVLTLDSTRQATFTGLVTVTQGTANVGVLASTGYSLTGSSTTSMVNLAGTWNTSGAPTAILLNITNTASSASSLLLDLQIGGASMLNVTRAGSVIALTSLRAGGTGTISWNTRSILSSPANAVMTLTNAAATNGFTVSVPTAVASPTLQLGALDAAAPVAQIMAVQNVLAGTSNTAGVSLTVAGSLSTGSGASGDIIFQTGGTGASATNQNVQATALTIKGASQSLVLGSAALTTNATGGFLYIPTCAGTPTGTPTAFTGRVPMVFDTTNSQFWFFTGGAWKQPKTPAGAALVTWQ